jgi:hypothetical protein
MQTSREQQLRDEMTRLVLKYQRDQRARGRELTYRQAEHELRGAAAPRPFDKATMEACLAVARKYGMRYQDVVRIMHGDYPQRYEAIALEKLPPVEGQPRPYADKFPDPAARSPAEVLAAVQNPGPTITLDGRPAVTGGTKIDGPTMRRLLDALRKRREDGEETLTFAEILDEFLKERRP